MVFALHGLDCNHKIRMCQNSNAASTLPFVNVLLTVTDCQVIHVLVRASNSYMHVISNSNDASAAAPNPPAPSGYGFFQVLCGRERSRQYGNEYCQ